MNGQNGGAHAPVETKKVTAPHLYIGTPCHDNRWHVMMAMSMIKLTGTAKMNLTTNKCSGGGVHKARNNIAHDFLKSGQQKMLWLDSDIGFEPEMVFQLYSRNLPIVAAPYTHKKPAPPGQPPAWSARAIDGEVPDPRTALQKVAAVGTGFLMIDRQVFLDIIAKFGPQIAFIEDWNEGTGEQKYDFYREGVVHDPEFGYPQPTFVTEDFYFCYMARKCGYEILVDCSFYVNHWEGSRCYPEGLPPPGHAAPKMPDHVQESDILNFRR